MKMTYIILIIASFSVYGQEALDQQNDLLNIQTRQSNMAKASMISLNT